MSDYKAYAQFNSLTITGRLSHAELVTNNGSEFLSVTLLTELVDEGETCAVTFNTTNGIMTMFKNGNLKTGRRITVTGHLASFSEIYFDKKLGKARRLQRPKLHLTKAVVFDGGLGPAKKEDSKISTDIEIDEAPAIA